MIRGVHKKHFGNAHLKHDPHASVNASLCVMSNQVIGVAAMFNSAVNKCRYPRSMVMLRVFSASFRARFEYAPSRMIRFRTSYACFRVLHIFFVSF